MGLTSYSLLWILLSTHLPYVPSLIIRRRAVSLVSLLPRLGSLYTDAF